MKIEIYSVLLWLGENTDISVFENKNGKSHFFFLNTPRSRS